MKQSAGILLYKKIKNSVEIFLVHPGGPYWKNKDLEAWSIPKGEYEDDEDPLDAARREFREETGFEVKGKFIALTPVKLKSGKKVTAWAVEGDVDAGAIKCETYINIEWPPKSGKQLSFPEVDKAGWFTVDEAKKKINPAQAALVNELINIIKV